MRYRTFGRLGWKISEVGFGAWAIGGSAWGKTDDEVSVRTMHQALDKGINLIDTPQAYSAGRLGAGELHLPLNRVAIYSRISLKSRSAIILPTQP